MENIRADLSGIYATLAKLSVSQASMGSLLSQLSGFISADWAAYIPEHESGDNDRVFWPKEFSDEIAAFLNTFPLSTMSIELDERVRILPQKNIIAHKVKGKTMIFKTALVVNVMPWGSFIFGSESTIELNSETKSALTVFANIFIKLFPATGISTKSPKADQPISNKVHLPLERSDERSPSILEDQSKGEEWFRNVAEYFPFPLFLSKLPEGNTFFVNQAFRKTFAPFQETHHDLPAISEFIQGEKEKKLIIELIRGKKTIKGLEIALKTKSRSVPTWFNLNSQHITLDTLQAAITVLVDIHQRRDAEEKLNRLNVLLQTLSEIQLNTYLQDDFEPSLDKFLENIMNITDCMVGYLGEAKPEGSLVTQAFINMHDSHTEDEPLNQGNKITHDSQLLSQLKTATLKAKKPLIFNNVSADAFHYALFNQQHSFNNFLGIPIYKGEELQGILALLDKEADFSEKDIEFLKPLVWGYANLMKSIHTHKEKTKAEQLRKEADNLYRLISENTGDIILLFDLDFKINYISPSVEKILGYKPGDLMGKKPSEAFGVSYPTSINFDEPHTLVIPHPTKDTDQTILLEILFKPLKNRKNVTYSILATYRDVTERETVLKKIKKNLMKERELNHLKSQFISMASHEFRTPLATIMSSAELMELFLSKEESTSPIIEKIHTHIKKINLQTSRLSEIISNMLLLEKSVQNDLKISSKKTPIIYFLKDQVHQFCEEVGREVSLFLPEKEKIVLTDPSCLTHIIRNLLQNAINYSGDSDKNVEVYLEFLNHSYEIRVKDFGMGIPKEDQKHIFETFFRARNVAKIKGTGLGLNIVKEFVNKLDGEITFSSKVGKGTEFVLRFPY